MISFGRYGYHLEDIAKFKAMPQPLSPVLQMILGELEEQVREFEQANSELVIEARRKKAVQSLKSYFGSDIIDISRVADKDVTGIVDFLLKLAREAQSESRKEFFLDYSPEERCYYLKRSDSAIAVLKITNENGHWTAISNLFLQIQGVPRKLS